MNAWRDEAACAGHAAAFDAASDGDRNLARAARKRWYAAQICHDCPVRLACFEDALTNREYTIEQVLGGMWFPQAQNLPPRRIGPPRDKPAKNPKPTPTLEPRPPRERKNPAEHGTRGGYARHMRERGGWTRPACAPCRAAEAAYSGRRKDGAA